MGSVVLWESKTLFGRHVIEIKSMNTREESMPFNPEKRAAWKARARVRDEERVIKGEIGALELQRENCHFSFLRERTVRVSFIPSSKRKSPRYLVIPARPHPDAIDDG